MYDRKAIREGMTVYSQDGERLGKVFAVGDDAFQIEKGLFFPRDALVRYDAIADVQGHDVILSTHKEALRPVGEEEPRARS
jgi:hypothetical protein